MHITEQPYPVPVVPGFLAEDADFLAFEYRCHYCGLIHVASRIGRQTRTPLNCSSPGQPIRLRLPAGDEADPGYDPHTDLQELLVLNGHRLPTLAQARAWEAEDNRLAMQLGRVIREEYEAHMQLSELRRSLGLEPTFRDDWHSEFEDSDNA